MKKLFVLSSLVFALFFIKGCSVDTDGDGTPDLADQCPTDPNKTEPGQCGCNIPDGTCSNDQDTDGDGTPDQQDQCPTDPNKVEPGQCGCNVDESSCSNDQDTDGDGTPDQQDQCPTDPNKVEPGQCGCNVDESSCSNDQDTDGDGTPDQQDQCPNDPNKINPGQCGCGVAEGTCSNDDPSEVSNKLLTGEELSINQYLESSNSLFRLYLQSDGNLVLRDHQTQQALWSSKTDGKPTARLVLQGDNNLVLYTDTGTAVWASNTVNSGATELRLNDNGILALYAGNNVKWSVPTEDPGTDPGDDPGDDPVGSIVHVGTTQVYDSDGQNLSIDRPSGSKQGDLLVLFLHRTDDDLPLYVNGWTRVAECFKRDNGYDCSTEKDCISWHNDDFCADFGGHGGHDLAQSAFVKTAGANEPSSYKFNLNIDSSGHPGWAILTALRGATTSNPVRDWAYKGCDGSADSIFPSVYGKTGDMVLLSQSFDDAVAQSKFGAPPGTTTFGYVSRSDEAGFLFGGVLKATGETGTMKTQGDGASNCKDALVSLTIKPK